MSLTRIIARQTMQQRRTFVNGWANKPDGGKIRATQQIFQDPAKAHLHGVDDPTYLKKAGDNMWFAFGGFLFFGASCAITRGIYNMSNGEGKLN